MLHHILFHLRAKNDALMFTQKYSKPQPKQMHIMCKRITTIILEYYWRVSYIATGTVISMKILGSYKFIKNIRTCKQMIKILEDLIGC